MFSSTETLLGLESSKDVVALLSVFYLLKEEAALADFSFVGGQERTKPKHFTLLFGSASW